MALATRSADPLSQGDSHAVDLADDSRRPQSAGATDDGGDWTSDAAADSLERGAMDARRSAAGTIKTSNGGRTGVLLLATASPPLIRSITFVCTSRAPDRPRAWRAPTPVPH